MKGYPKALVIQPLVAICLIGLYCASCKSGRTTIDTPVFPAATGEAVSRSSSTPISTATAVIERATHVHVSQTPTEILAVMPSPTSTATNPPPLELPPLSANNVKSLVPLVKISSSGVYFCAFGPNGRHLAIVAQDMADRSWSVRLWDMQQGRLVGDLSGGPRFSFGSDGRTITVANWEGGLTVWDVTAGSVVRSMATKPVLALADGLSLGLVFNDHDSERDRSSVGLISTIDASNLHTFSLTGTPVAGLFSPSGRLVAISTGGISSETTFWDTDSGQLVHRVAEIDRLAFSPGGRWLAALFVSEPAVRIVNVVDWTIHAEMELEEGARPQSLLFSPDERTLTGAMGHTVLFWEADSGRLVADLDYQASSVAFSPDGRQLATVDFSDGVTIWGIP